MKPLTTSQLVAIGGVILLVMTACICIGASWQRASDQSTGVCYSTP